MGRHRALADRRNIFAAAITMGNLPECLRFCGVIELRCNWLPKAPILFGQLGGEVLAVS
jgi:hypothetical protein